MAQIRYGSLTIAEDTSGEVVYDHTNGTDRTTERSFDVWADAGVSTASAYESFYAWAKANHAQDSFGHGIKNIRFTSEESGGGNVWKAVIRWSSNKTSLGSTSRHEAKKPDQYFADSFSTKGGRGVKKYAIAQTAYAVDESIGCPDFGLGINWNGSDFDGVEIDTPAFSFGLKRRFAYEECDTEFQQTLADMTGTVNAAEYHGFSAGNVKFNGVEGATTYEYEGDTEWVDGELVEIPRWYWDLNFEFACSPERIVEVSGLAVPKGGWEYVWVYSEMFDDPDTGYTYRQPLGVYVAQVFYSTDFNQLSVE